MVTCPLCWPAYGSAVVCEAGVPAVNQIPAAGYGGVSAACGSWVSWQLSPYLPASFASNQMRRCTAESYCCSPHRCGIAGRVQRLPARGAFPRAVNSSH